MLFCISDITCCRVFATSELCPLNPPISYM
nr:MAG TPA: Her-1 protein 3-10 helix left-handed [Caudoviricetes sp.]